MQLFLTLACVFLGTHAKLFGKSQVCYDAIGCFSTDNGFGNAWGELPDSPSKVGVTMTLFTRKTAGHGHVLDITKQDAFAESAFDPKEKTKVIIHGYLSYAGKPWITNSTKYFLHEDNYNVITVDWKQGASHKFYPKSVANTRVVGAVVAKVMATARDMLGANMEDVHLIGHSLGAHISGYVGSRTEGIGRITGLDPAGPLFENVETSVRLDPTDALFVDNIHTDGVPIIHGGFGTQAAWGHIDFYPNGATFQPGCPAPVKEGFLDLVEFKFRALHVDVSCSHTRSHDYFVESLADNDCNFTSYPCESYQKYQQGACTSCGADSCPRMGYYADKTGNRGKFYLSTSGTYPYCIPA